MIGLLCIHKIKSLLYIIVQQLRSIKTLLLLNTRINSHKRLGYYNRQDKIKSHIYHLYKHKYYFNDYFHFTDFTSAFVDIRQCLCNSNVKIRSCNGTTIYLALHLRLYLLRKHNISQNNFLYG